MRSGCESSARRAPSVSAEHPSRVARGRKTVCAVVRRDCAGEWYVSITRPKRGSAMLSGRSYPIGSLVLLALSLWTPADAADYEIRTFDLPGGSFSYAAGINAAGRVVGFYSDPQTGQEHGFLRSTD